MTRRGKTVNPIQYELAVAAELEWVRSKFSDEFAQVNQRLDNETTTEYAFRRADFFDAHQLYALKAKVLDEARVTAEGQGNAELTLRTADALREAGFHDAAVETYRYIPIALQQPNAEELTLLGTSLRNKAFSLEELGRGPEARANDALATYLETVRDKLK